MNIRLAKQDVIRPGLARGHGLVPGCKTTDTGNAIGFEDRKRFLHGRQAGQMRAVGPCAGDQFGFAVEQQRHAARLDRGSQRLG